MKQLSNETIRRLIDSGICPAESVPELVMQLEELSAGLQLSELKQEAETFKALSDPRRLKIIGLLGHRKMCVCEINFSMCISQPAVSHHLNILEKAKLIQSERRGKWVFYSLRNRKVLDLMENVRKLIQSQA